MGSNAHAAFILFDKTVMSAKVEEFDFNAVGSLAFSTKLGGESIDIAISGRSATISQVAHGRAETFIAAFGRVRAEPAVAQVRSVSAPDLADQSRKLSELRDAGIINEAEFSSKKADLLSRM